MKWFRKNGAAQSPSPLLISHSALRCTNYEQSQSDNYQPISNSNTGQPQLEHSGRTAGEPSGGWATISDERLQHVSTEEDVASPHWSPSWNDDADASDERRRRRRQRLASGNFVRIDDASQVVAAIRSKGKINVFNKRIVLWQTLAKYCAKINLKYKIINTLV